MLLGPRIDCEKSSGAPPPLPLPDEDEGPKKKAKMETKSARDRKSHGRTSASTIQSVMRDTVIALPTL